MRNPHPLRPAILVGLLLASGLTACSKKTDDKSFLTAIAVSPAGQSLAPGATLQLTATGKYSTGKTSNLTGAVTWTSLDPAVATVSAGGLVTAGTATGGTATFTAQQGETVGIAQVSVTGAALGVVQVRPGSLKLPSAIRQQFLVVGVYADGTERDLSSIAAVSTDDASVATAVCTPTGCFVDTVAAGSTAISASVASLGATIQLEVTSATLTSLLVAPGNLPQLEVGATLGFSAYGRFDDGVVLDLTDIVDWSSSDDTLATVSTVAPTKGQATGVAVGAPTIQASLGGVTSVAQPLDVVASAPDYRESRISFSYSRVASADLLVSGDDFAAALPVLDPVFTFNLYGSDYTSDQIFASTNGMLSFGSGDSNTNGPTSIPLAPAPNGFVAISWYDLFTSVSTEVRGTAPTRELVVQWIGLTYSGGHPLEFQTVLHETTNEIDFLYVTTGTDYGVSALVGIESPDGLVGTQHSSNARAIVPNMAIRFSP